jgi:hypothetical protein
MSFRNTLSTNMQDCLEMWGVKCSLNGQYESVNKFFFLLVLFLIQTSVLSWFQTLVKLLVLNKINRCTFFSFYFLLSKLVKDVVTKREW